MHEARSPGDRDGAEAASVSAHLRLQRSREALVPVLAAFEGLEVLAVVISGLPVQDGAPCIESLTPAGVDALVASLSTWSRLHPSRAFEASILLPSLRDLARALSDTMRLVS